jgi:hypothetical protein
MRPYKRVNVPGSSFRYCLAVLSKSATFIFATPEQAEREAEQALAHVQVYLSTQRIHEEERRHCKDDYEHSMARLRMKWDRHNLVILKENLWEHVNAGPPIGPAVKVMTTACKLTIEELDLAYRRAPRLKDERDEVEFDDPIMPEPAKVDYDGLVDNDKAAKAVDVKDKDILT